MYYKNGTIYNSQQSIRNDNKDTSLPVFMTDKLIESLGYIKIVDGIKPTPNDVQYVVEDGVQVLVGVPTQTYILKDMFSDTAEYINLDGVVVPAKTKAEHEAEYLAKLQADAMAKLVQHFTSITDNFIQAKVVAYNKANGTDFASIVSFPKYAVVPTDSRNAISLQFLAWNGKIWDSVNTIRTTAITTGVVPTEEEFLAVLESVVF